MRLRLLKSFGILPVIYVAQLMWCAPAPSREIIVPVSDRLIDFWTWSVILPCSDLKIEDQEINELLKQRSNLEEDKGAAVRNNAGEQVTALNRRIFAIDTEIRQRRALQETLGSRDYNFKYSASTENPWAGLDSVGSGRNAVGFVLGQSRSQIFKAVPPSGSINYTSAESAGKITLEITNPPWDGSMRGLQINRSVPFNRSVLSRDAVQEGNEEFSMVVEVEKYIHQDSCRWVPHYFNRTHFEDGCTLFDFSPVTVSGKGTEICKRAAALGSYTVTYDLDEFRRWFGGPMTVEYRIGAPDDRDVPPDIRELIYGILNPLIRDALGQEKSYRVSDDIFIKVGVPPSRRASVRFLLDRFNSAIAQSNITQSMLDRLFDNPQRYVPIMGYRVAFRLPLPRQELFILFERTAGGLDISGVEIGDPAICPYSAYGKPVKPWNIDGFPICIANFAK